ncbi:MAG: glutathione peroxidase [Spirochaetaceae bacterium]|jgi:glutathione peroxidase|nr:glutathione peroxidase [Spirochaetaceae bacterium]
MTVYDFTVKDGNGKDVLLRSYEGKVLLIVNTATGCGFTPQYAGLQRLYEDYQGRGLEILDFPCNQFAGQAPGTDIEIDSFCTSNYHTTFPRFAKVEVNGKNTSPLYRFLKAAQPGVLGSQRIKWNFTKFLVDKAGTVVARYGPDKKPEAIEAGIVGLL